MKRASEFNGQDHSTAVLERLDSLRTESCFDRNAALGLKPDTHFAVAVAWLKPCPCYKHFFSSSFSERF